jgi:hypothetical protein
VNGVTVFTDSGGNIQVLLQGVLYTLTPTQIKYLSTLGGDISSLFAAANSYTDAKIAALVGTAPSTLDTLQEMAVALQQDQNSISALNTAINSKGGLSQNNTWTGTNDFSAITCTSLNTIPASTIAYLNGTTSSIQAQLNILTNTVAAVNPYASRVSGARWGLNNTGGALPTGSLLGQI